MLANIIGIWIVLALAAGVIAYSRGGRPLPWLIGTLLIPPLLLWVMLMPIGQRHPRSN